MTFSSTRGFGLLSPRPETDIDGEDSVARLKKRIGFSDEPVQDAEGYWVIGYGRRLSDTPGGRKPETYWSEGFTDEELRHRLTTAEGRKAAHALAAMGRGDDSEIAHVATGEIILPLFLQTPEVMWALRAAADRVGTSLDELRVGMPENSVNPTTGAPEFGVISKMFGTNWCGLGGDGPTLNKLDEACKQHDICYKQNDLTAGSNWNFLPPDKVQALTNCNQDLYDATETISDCGAGLVRFYFNKVPIGAARPR